MYTLIPPIRDSIDHLSSLRRVRATFRRCIQVRNERQESVISRTAFEVDVVKETDLLVGYCMDVR